MSTFENHPTSFTNSVALQLQQMAKTAVSVKLNKTNYLCWRSLTRPFLIGQNLFGVIDESFPRPPEHINVEGSDHPHSNPAFRSWEQEDQLVVSILLSSISHDVVPLVIDCVESKEIWKRIEQTFSSLHCQKIIVLRTQLLRLKQGDDEKVLDYLNKAKAIEEELAEAGSPLSLKDFNTCLLKGLKPDFNGLISRLSRRLVPIEFQELQTRLVGAEHIYNFYSNRSEVGSAANSTLSTVKDDASPRKGWEWGKIIEDEIKAFEKLRGHILVVCSMIASITFPLAIVMRTTVSTWLKKPEDKILYHSLEFNNSMSFCLAISKMGNLVIGFRLAKKSSMLTALISMLLTLYFLANTFYILLLLSSIDDDGSRTNSRIFFIFWLLFFIICCSCFLIEIVVFPVIRNCIQNREDTSKQQ